MLSKSRGQVLRLSAVIHMLFNLGSDEPQDDIVSENAVKAAIDLVHTGCQQAANTAGQSSLEEEILRFKDGNGQKCIICTHKQTLMLVHLLLKTCR